MKNLKRLLCLALTGVMLSGMMVMGASATNFPDDDEIINQEAVDTMVALSIINGKDDGAFHPTDNVTRAEMAKMIATAVNGGVAPEFGVKTVPTFTDIKGHWAEQFIEYCADMKYINGRGDGTFDPNGNVTGIEAAKMVLTALGYDATAYQLVGADWAINVSSIASRTCKPISLYDELSGTNLNVAATRDTAAQLLWNGLQNYTVEFNPNRQIVGTDLSYQYAQTTETLLKHAYKADIKYGFMKSFVYDADDEVFTYGIDAGDIDTDEFDGDVTLAKDITHLYGHKVQIVYKADKAGNVGTLYGITAAKGDKILGTEILGNIPTIGDGESTEPGDSKIKINGTTYRVESTLAGTPVVEFLNEEAEGGMIPANAKLATLPTTGKVHYTMDLVDWDGNNKVDVIIVHPILVGKVNAVGTKTISINSISGGDNSTKSFTFKDNDIYSDVAVDDYALVTPAANTAKNRALIEEADITSGTVDALRGTNDTANPDIKLDGTWYKDNRATVTAISLGEEYNMVIVNGYVFFADAVEEIVNLDNLVFITGYADEEDATNKPLTTGQQTVRLLFTDGTESVVTVTKLNGVKIGKTLDSGKSNIISDTNDNANILYTYKKSGSNYELTAYEPSKFDKTTTSSAKVEDGRVDTTRFNSDAVIFVVKDANTSKQDAEVITGATVAKWEEQNLIDGSLLYTETKSNGYDYTMVGLLFIAEKKLPGETGKSSYGYITAKSARVKNNGDYYISMTIWNGEETVTVLAESTFDGTTETSVTNSTSVTGWKAGVIVKYDDLGNGKVAKVQNISGDLTVGAVTAYEDPDISVYDIDTDTEITDIVIDDNTVTLYVDTEDNVGYETGKINLADQTRGEDDYIANILILKAENRNKNDKYPLTLIVYDTNNKLDSKFTND